MRDAGSAAMLAADQPVTSLLGALVIGLGGRLDRDGAVGLHLACFPDSPSCVVSVSVAESSVTALRHAAVRCATRHGDLGRPLVLLLATAETLAAPVALAALLGSSLPPVPLARDGKVWGSAGRRYDGAWFGWDGARHAGLSALLAVSRPAEGDLDARLYLHPGAAYPLRGPLLQLPRAAARHGQYVLEPGLSPAAVLGLPA